jgi:predicted cupin superfamily sugar epimerase
MPRVSLLACLLATLAGPLLRAADPVAAPTDPRARDLIASYGMTYLPGESGYLAFIGRSPLKVTVDGQSLDAQNQIYYLLTREAPTNYLHWLADDDTHILLEGGPLDYFIFHPDGRVEKRTLGRDRAKGEELVIAVPAGCWKALRLHPGVGFALMANVLSPGFSADRVKIGAGEDWIGRYRGKAPWATPALLRELIGPNLTMP